MKKKRAFGFSVLLVLALTNCTPRLRQPLENIENNIRYEENIDYIKEGGSLELPVTGASGWAAIDIPLYQFPDQDGNTVTVLKAGHGFTILREEGDWWFAETGGIRGWVENQLCMINIPDVIPSIVHNNTNTYSSLFRTSGVDIPNITGKALYQSRDFNARLDREEYIAPVLYGMIGKIFSAQQAALADGNTLIIYESFRPSAPHQELYENMLYLVNKNPAVRSGVQSGTFRMDLFLAPAPYNHQRGTAIDASLGKITGTEKRTTGSYEYTYITGYTEYPMQTEMHELSVASAVFKTWVNARTLTGWHDGVFADSVTEGTKLLQKYCTDAGLTPLASEWWHFNDLDWSPPFIDLGITGEFFIEKTNSTKAYVIRQ